MSQLHVQQIRGYLDKEIARHIDLSDVASAPSDQKESASLTRSLAAFAVMHLADTTPEVAGASVTDGTGDNGLDAVFHDRTEKTLIIVQSKWHGDGRGSIERGDGQKLITGVHDLVNTSFDRFNDKLRLRSSEVEGAIFDAQTRILVVLIHSGQDALAKEVSRDLDDFLREMNDPTDTVACRIMDQRAVHGLIAEGVKGLPIDLEVALSEWGQVKDPFGAVYGYVQAADVAAWWDRFYPRLFAPNLRLFLGNTDVNNGILETIKTAPDHFWYYNNGITALCHEVSKKPIGGASRDHGIFECKGVTVVNGAQTVGAIAMAAASHPTEVAKARVLIRFISLKDAPSNLASLITQYTNTQNRIERRDFVALDPEQDRLKTEIQLDGVEYVFKSGDRVPSGKDGFDLAEASVALACSQADVTLAVQAKREIGKLWEDISEAPYKALFNPNLNGRHLWHLVRVLREIEVTLDGQKQRLLGRNRLYAVHGNRFVSWLVMQALPADAEAPEVSATTLRCVEATVDNGNTLFPDVYLASLFKNASKCKRLAEAVQVSLNRRGDCASR